MSLTISNLNFWNTILQDRNFILIILAAMSYIFTIKCNKTALEIQVETSEHLRTVGDLKRVVHKLLCIAPDKQRMIYQGKSIQGHSDDFLLEKYLAKPLGEGCEKLVFVWNAGLEEGQVSKPRVSAI